MTYVDTVLATPGLIGFWKLDDASGDALDSTANALALTVAATGITRNTEQLCNGIASSMTSDGVASGGYLNRAVTQNSVADLRSTVTVCSWVKMLANTASGTKHIVGMDTTYRLVCPASQQLAAALGGGTAPPAGAPAFLAVPGLATGEIVFLGLSWSEKTNLLTTWINGVPVRSVHRPGPLAYDSAPIRVWNFSGGVNARQAGVAMFNRVLTAGEMSALYDAGRLAASVVKSPDVFNPGGAGTIQSAGRAPVTLTATEAQILTAAGETYRPDEYGARGMRYGAAFLTSNVAATNKDRLPDEVCKIVSEMVLSHARSGHPTMDPAYHDGTEFKWTGSSVTFRRSTAPIITALAALHRHQNMAKDRSWPLGFAKKHFAFMQANQKPAGDANAGAILYDDFSNNTYFIAHQLAESALMLKNHLDTPTLASWKATAVAAGGWVYNDNNAFYVNGNFELQVCITYYALWLLTGDSLWKTRFDTQWVKMLAPGTGISSGSGLGNAQVSGFGLKDGTSNALVDIATLSNTTGKAYLAESNNPGTVGLDWDYLHYQTVLASRLWLLSGDANHLKLLNVLVNKALERLTVATWVYDATGGVRHSLATSWLTPALTVLQWAGGRGDLTYDLGDHFWRKVLSDFRNGQGSTNENFWAWVGDTFVPMLKASPRWPGLPA